MPALFLRSGVEFVGRPEEWGSEQEEAWIATRYHQPSDDFDPARQRALAGTGP